MTVRCTRCQRRLSEAGSCPLHGTTSAVVDVCEPVPAVRPPDGWALHRYLGSGASAHVFVIRRGDGREAVLKCARSLRREIASRLRSEVRALDQLAGQVAPRLLDHGARHVVMEYCPGPTLATWMARHGARGSLGEILALLSQLATALAAIHAHGICHGDLKPENIVITTTGVRIVDFGASAVPGAASSPGGTAHYQAPEHLERGVVDPRADLYALGVIAFEMLAGRPPFVGDRGAIAYQHRLVPPPSLKESRDIPDDLDAVVRACLAKSPADRPQSAADLRAWLARASLGVSTERGMGDPRRVSGARGPVALAWIDRGDVATIAAAIVDGGGVVIRRHGESLLAAFTWLDHASPVDAAVRVVRRLVACRRVVHLGSALVRRSTRGRISMYGDDVDQIERWLRAPVTDDLVITEAARAALGRATPRTVERVRTSRLVQL